jgi:molybdate transport system ATP-binding protein
MTTDIISTVSADFFVTAGSFDVRAQFSVGRGITTLFGPSGAGKSITLSAIAGLVRPMTGTIVLHDTVVADADKNIHVPTQERNIGMVFQHAALLPHRSPLDNVALSVRHRDPDHSMTRAERRHTARQWLERVQGAHLANATTSTLSGGEQQRVALARALASNPTTLLLDEPFTALDYKTRQSLRELVRGLVAEHSITALLVTHDLEDIVQLANTVVMFEPGATLDTHQLVGNGRDVREQLTKLVGLSD